MVKRRIPSLSRDSNPRSGITNVYKILVGKLERQRTLARSRCRWEDIWKVLRETRWKVEDWMGTSDGLPETQQWTFGLHMSQRYLLSCSKNSPSFVQLERSLLFSQEPASGPYAGPDESSPISHTIVLRPILILSSRIHAHLNLLSGLFPSVFELKCMCIYIYIYFTCACYISRQSHSSW